MGKAQIWVDGSLSATIDLYRSAKLVRAVVWEAHWDTAASHTVIVKVVGTPGRPRVELDEFVRF